MIEAITGAFLLLFLFWTIGYFANALYGMHFEIRSCWDGFTTLGGAGVLVTVLAEDPSNPSAALLGEVRQMEDRLGLSPMALIVS